MPISITWSSFIYAHQTGKYFKDAKRFLSASRVEKNLYTESCKMCKTINTLNRKLENILTFFLNYLYIILENELYKSALKHENIKMNI